MKPGIIFLQHIDDVKSLANACRIRELRVFGSVARHEDRDSSDLDLLAFYTEEATIFDHAAFTCQLTELLGIECDVLSDEILDKDGFADMMEKSISLDDFAAGKYAVKGAVSREERSASGADNLSWIIQRITDTIGSLSYDEFLLDSVRYDALAYQFQLLSSIVSNSDPQKVLEAEAKYGVDLSGSSILHEMMLTTIYPRMLYQAAKKLAAAE